MPPLKLGIGVKLSYGAFCGAIFLIFLHRLLRSIPRLHAPKKLNKSCAGDGVGVVNGVTPFFPIFAYVQIAAAGNISQISTVSARGIYILSAGEISISKN